MHTLTESYPIHVLSAPNSKPETPSIWTVDKAPEKLFIQGSEQALELLNMLPTRGFAIVGTRCPSARSLLQVQHLVEQLKGTDLIILSGFARGIDAAAHEAAIKAGLPTIAILGTSLGTNYPRENSELRQAILKNNGLIVSEFPSDFPTYADHFLQRNRLIAGWSNAVWIVEAAKKSGALNTAKWAREHHRTCFATPCYPGDPALAGNQNLIDEHHAAVFWGVHNLGQVWLELAARPVKQPSLFRNNPSLFKKKPELQHVFELTNRVSTLTFEQGGAPVAPLLDWAIAQGWTPGIFFETLQTALNERLLLDENGLLLKNPIRSV